MLAAAPFIRRAAYGLTAGLVGAGLFFRSSNSQEDEVALRKRDLAMKVPGRADILDSLKSGKEFDVLVIGGGATGTGIALVRRK